MATFDISRVAFNPLKHYTSVRAQQGRVPTDDDVNEQRRIDEEIIRRTNTDVIGAFGSPDNGFRIVNWHPTSQWVDFDIQDGVVYLGGLRLEMEKTKTARGTEAYETFLMQNDYLGKDTTTDSIPTATDIPTGNERFDLVYLEAWQQPVSAVEDDTLLEPALGSDTSTRVRNMRRVKIFKNTGSPECALSWRKVIESWTNDHKGLVNAQFERVPNIRMRVSFTTGSTSADPCTPSIAGGYLGAENQAIRVQLTKPNAFTWGFDNASPYYRVTLDTAGTQVTMITPPKDQYHWPLTGQVVEILPWSAVMVNGRKVAEQSGMLRKVNAAYDPDNKQFLLDQPVSFPNTWLGAHTYYYMRVWNRGSDLASPAEINLTEGTAAKLGNTGLQVTFSRRDSAIAMDPVPEDHWVIAARPKTPDQLIPIELLQGTGPNGVRRFFAPLGVIRWTNNAGTITGEIIHDCRPHFNPLTEQECCCTFTVGDRVQSRGDFQSIQDAIDALPAEGGKICLMAGVFDAQVLIRKRQRIIITACGDQTIVRPGENTTGAIIRIENSQRITIENITFISVDDIAIEVIDTDPKASPSEEITIDNNTIMALIHGVNVRLQEDRGGDNNIKITNNLISMFDLPNGKVAIFSLADAVLIERNRIVVPKGTRPPGGTTQPQPPTGEQPPGDVYDPCANRKKIYADRERFKKMTAKYARFARRYVPVKDTTDFQAPGGIQIGCSSEKVRVLQNEILGGRGVGVLLGHARVNKDGSAASHLPFIYEIAIEENRIQLMGNSGIAPEILSDGPLPVVLVRICICSNRIIECVQQLDVNNIDGGKAFGGIILPFCEEGNINGNRIEENGRSHIEPICGILILHAEKVDISNNFIVNNGPRINEYPDDRAIDALRGGIIIRMAHRSPSYTIKATNISVTQIPDDSLPAVKVHDNVVIQPLGHSLFIIAMGPVSVISNQFTTQGIVRRNKVAYLAGCVLIINLGISKDLIHLFRASYGKVKTFPMHNPGISIGTSKPGSKILEILRRFQMLPSGKTLFVANQSTLDLRSFNRSESFSAQLVLSLDDVGFHSNQCESASLYLRGDLGNVITSDTVLVNTMTAGITVRTTDNRFTDGYTGTLLSLFSFAAVNTTTGNQGTHCIIPLGRNGFTVNIHNIVIDYQFCRILAQLIYALYGKKVP